MPFHVALKKQNFYVNNERQNMNTLNKNFFNIDCRDWKSK